VSRHENSYSNHNFYPSLSLTALSISGQADTTFNNVTKWFDQLNQVLTHLVCELSHYAHFITRLPTAQFAVAWIFFSLARGLVH
jgi:hypothetical protein